METGKMTLSKREKRLIFLAGCVGFLAIMVMLVIIPLNNRLMDNRVLHSELEAEQMQMEIELLTEEATRAAHAEALSNFEQIRTVYRGESLASEIGLMLTQKVTEHNLEPISQSISPPEDFIVPRDDEEQQEEAEAVFKSMSVSMVVAGEYNDVRRLLNTVEGIQYHRVGNVTLRFTRDEAEVTATGRINLRFDILMLSEDIM